jgi:hypothetical protein
MRGGRGLLVLIGRLPPLLVMLCLFGCRFGAMGDADAAITQFDTALTYALDNPSTLFHIHPRQCFNPCPPRLLRALARWRAGFF